MRRICEVTSFRDGTMGHAGWWTPRNIWNWAYDGLSLLSGTCPNRVCLLPKCVVSSGYCGQSAWVWLIRCDVHMPLGSSASCHHNGYEKNMRKIWQKPGERMSREPGLKLKLGWKWVKFPEARGGKNLAIHGEKHPKVFHPKLVYVLCSLEGPLDILTQTWWRLWENQNCFQGPWPYSDPIPKKFEEIKKKSIKVFDRHRLT